MKLGLTMAVNAEVDGEWSFNQPLGLGYIASYLKKYSPHIDEIIIERDIDTLLAQKPDIVGITTVSFSYSVAQRQARRVKEELGCPVWIGGPHISSLPGSMSRDFDIGVLCEGELTALELVEAYSSTSMHPTASDLSKIRGIQYWDNDVLVRNPARTMIDDLDKIPQPDRLLMDGKWGDNKVHPTIMTSRGCPYNCSFCATPVIWGRGFRGHGAEYICDEIETLRDRYDCDNIIFNDDLFIANKKRFRAIVAALEKRRLLDGISTRCFVRVNMMDDETCDLLSRINSNILYTGFESNSEPILRELGKTGVKPADNQNMIELCRKYGFEVASCFIVGSPSETREDILATYQFITDNADALQASVVTPLMVCPGTRVWQWAVERGLCGPDNLTGVVMEPEDFNSEDFMRNRYIYLNTKMERAEFINLLNIGYGISKMVNSFSAARWEEKQRKQESGRIPRFKSAFNELRVD
jgi:radical SAM superfamily enzyme YgiQ (UPF0313 family)